MFKSRSESAAPLGGANSRNSLVGFRSCGREWIARYDERRRPLVAGGRALEREGGLAPEIVERRLEEDEDLGDGVERERLEAVGREGGGEELRLAHLELSVSTSGRKTFPRGSLPLRKRQRNPYAETKEQLGSYFLIEARDLDEAIQMASKHPAARLNDHLGWGVEVRPIETCRVGVAAGKAGQ